MESPEVRKAVALEVADDLGVTQQRVSQLAAGDGFPPPAIGGRPTDVEAVGGRAVGRSILVGDSSLARAELGLRRSEMEESKGPDPEDMSLQEIEDMVRREKPGAWEELLARAASHSAEGEIPTSPDGLKGFSEDDLFQWVNQNPTDAVEGPNDVIRFMRTRCTQELIARGWTVAGLAARTGRTTDEIADLAARRWDEYGLEGE